MQDKVDSLAEAASGEKKKICLDRNRKTDHFCQSIPICGNVCGKTEYFSCL